MNNFISISSRDRTSGNSNDFKIKLTTPIEDIRFLKSVTVTIPVTWYTVMSGINDKIYITVAGPTTYTATLTEGNYTFANLIVEVQTQINAAYTPDNNFTVTQSALTEKITVTHSGTNFQLTWSTNTTASARKLLGFSETDTTSGLSSTSDIIPKLSHDDTLFIRSQALASGMSWACSEKKQFILTIPVNGNFGDIFSYQSQGDNWIIYYRDSRGKNLSDIDLGLYFEDCETLVPLNGADWRISFQLYPVNRRERQ